MYPKNVTGQIHQRLFYLVSILDIERSKQVHDDSIEYIKDLNELIKMNLFGTDLSDEGLVSNL